MAIDQSGKFPSGKEMTYYIHNFNYRMRIGIALFYLVLIVYFPPILEQAYISGFESDNFSELTNESKLYFLGILSMPIKILILLLISINAKFSIERIINNKSGFIYIILSIFIIQIVMFIPSGFQNALNLMAFYVSVVFLTGVIGADEAVKCFIYYNAILLFIGLALLFNDSELVKQCFYGCGEYLFKGLYIGKNTLGLASSLVVFLSISFGDKIFARKYTKLFLYLVGGLSLLLSSSITSITSLAICIYLYYLFRIGRMAGLFASSFLFIVLVASFSSGLIDALFEALGRDATLSGRVVIWYEILPKIGFSLFSDVGYGNSADYVREISSFSAIDSTWVVIYTEMGIIFSLCYALWLFRGIFKSAYNENSEATRFIFVIMILVGFTEKSGGPYIGPLLLLCLCLTTDRSYTKLMKNVNLAANHKGTH